MNGHGTTRDQVVDAGLDLFVSRGYADTSLREIAAEVGLTKAALYHHFPTKVALLDAILGPLADDVDEVLEMSSDDEDLDRHRWSLLDAYLTVLVRHRRRASLYYGDRSIRHEAIGQRAAEQQRRLIRRMIGQRASLETLVRVHGALAVVRMIVKDLSDVPPERLRRLLLTVAAETCTPARAGTAHR